MRHWEMLYEHPPRGRDTLVFAAAFLLHIPLVFMKMDAPAKPLGRTPYVDVTLLDAGVLPPRVTVPPPVTPSVDLDRLKKAIQDITVARLTPLRPLAPTITPPKILTPPVVKPIALPRPPPLADKGKLATPAPLLGAGPRGINTGGTARGPIADTGKRFQDNPVSPALRDNKAFIGQDQISGIGGGSGIRVAPGHDTVTIRTTQRAAQDLAAVDPLLKVDRGPFNAGGPGNPSGGGTGDLAGGLAAPKPAKKPAFVITGVLADRKAVYQEMPVYPPSLRSKGIESAVHLRFIVTPDGNVKNVSITRLSGYPEMDKAAVAALRKWSFVPLDRYEEQEGTIIMTFSLR